MKILFFFLYFFVAFQEQNYPLLLNGKIYSFSSSDLPSKIISGYILADFPSKWKIKQTIEDLSSHKFSYSEKIFLRESDYSYMLYGDSTTKKVGCMKMKEDPKVDYNLCGKSGIYINSEMENGLFLEKYEKCQFDGFVRDFFGKTPLGNNFTIFTSSTNLYSIQKISDGSKTLYFNIGNNFVFPTSILDKSQMDMEFSIPRICKSH